MTEPQPVPIRDQKIDLDQFLKLAGVAQTGGHAKFLIQEGAVSVNGEAEARRRRKLVVGDVVEAEGAAFAVVALADQ